MKKRGFLVMISVFLAVTTLSPNAFATPIAPGGTGVPTASTGFGNTILADTGSLAFTASPAPPSWFGTFRSLVVVESVASGGIAGNLDFYYQVTNDALSRQSIDRETVFNFNVGSIWTTDVYYRSDAPFGGLGTLAPVSADRTGNGNSVGFAFSSPADLRPGVTTDWVFIRTNATAFTAGGASLIDGGVTSVVAYSPAVPVPPAVLLLGTGLVGLVGLRYRRKRQG